MRNFRPSLRTLALLSLLGAITALGEPPQNPGAPAPEPQSPAQSSEPRVAAPADPGTREILSSVQGYGNKLNVPVLQPSGARYRVIVGDQIIVRFTLLHALDETVTVRPDGTISVIGAPDVYVEHQSVPELIDTIKKDYEGLLTPPVMVTVQLANTETPYFVVGGQVTNPGKFKLKGDLTVAESVEIAGGFLLSTAKDSRVLLFRRISTDFVEARMIDLKRILHHGDLADDIHLQSGDLVFVPKNRLSKVQPFISYFFVYNVFSFNFGTTYRIDTP